MCWIFFLFLMFCFPFCFRLLSVKRHSMNAHACQESFHVLEKGPVCHAARSAASSESKETGAERALNSFKGSCLARRRPTPEDAETGIASGRPSLPVKWRQEHFKSTSRALRRFETGSKRIGGISAQEKRKCSCDKALGLCVRHL